MGGVVGYNHETVKRKFGWSHPTLLEQCFSNSSGGISAGGTYYSNLSAEFYIAHSGGWINLRAFPG